MSVFIVKNFIEEIMERCIDKDIESNQIPQIIIDMLLEVQDDGNIDEIFERITEDCSIDPYGDIESHKSEILQSVLSEMTIHVDNELIAVTNKYEDAGYPYFEARQRAINTEYMKQLAIIIGVLEIMVNEIERIVE